MAVAELLEQVNALSAEDKQELFIGAAETIGLHTPSSGHQCPAILQQRR